MVEETLSANNLQKNRYRLACATSSEFTYYHGNSEKLEMDMSQVVVTLDRTANTSAATVPTALDEAVRDGRIQRGQLLLLEAFWRWLDLGFSIGAILINLLESRQNFKSAVKI